MQCPITQAFRWDAKLLRAYASSKVVEFVRKPNLQCSTPVGQDTGLEAEKVCAQ